MFGSIPIEDELILVVFNYQSIIKDKLTFLFKTRCPQTLSFGEGVNCPTHISEVPVIHEKFSFSKKGAGGKQSKSESVVIKLCLVEYNIFHNMHKRIEFKGGLFLLLGVFVHI